MTIQRLQRFMPFAIDRSTAPRPITFLLLLLAVTGLPALAGAQQACLPDGDVDRNGSVTAADALLAFQQALGLAQLTACQRTIANVFPQPTAPDRNITASDALCIFQKALSLPSCLDHAPPPNEPPVVDAGSDQSVDAGTEVILAGMATDPDGVITSYLWEQTGGTMVTLSGAHGANAVFAAPDVSVKETLTFRFTAKDDDGAVNSDDVSVTVRAGPEIDVAQYLTGPVEQGESPGLIVAIIHAQGVVRAAGAAGVRRQGSPDEMTVDDLFHIASCGKAMTATTLAVLIDDGVFPNDWDTTIADVFPELKEIIRPAYHDVTLFRLLRMTGGLSDAHFDWNAHQDEPDIMARRYAIMRELLALTPAGPTGKWEYSNLSYVVAGAMAERLTGQSWDTLMQTHLLDPLGMTTAGFGWPGAPDAVDQPWAHPVDEMGAWTPTQPVVPDTIGPAGNVHLSVEDWAKFIALWFRSRTPAILDRAALDELLVTDAPYYAAGWSVGGFSGEPAISHSGAGGGSGFSVTVKILPDRGLAFVAFANTSSEYDPATGENRVFSLLDSIFANLNQDVITDQGTVPVSLANPDPLDLPLRAVHAAGNWGTNRGVVDAWNENEQRGRLVPSDYIEYLRRLRADWVGLSVALHYDDSMDSTVERVYGDVSIPTFTDDALRQIIRELRAAGFGVYLTLAFEAHEAEDAARPVRRWQLGDPGHPDTGVPPDDPEVFGHILPDNWPWRPHHPDHQRFVTEFWETYTTQAVHFARIAEEEGARLFSLGTETDRLFRTRSGGYWPNHFRPEMEAMVRRVRAVYSGALTYDMHYSVLTGFEFFGTGSDHLWQDLDLDVVGVSAWFPLASTPPTRVTSRAVLQGHWERIFQAYLIPLADRNPGLPVMFLEHGAMDIVEAAADPTAQGPVDRFVFSDEDGNGLDDGRETQANMAGALLDTMNTYPGVVNGVFWWDNWLASDGMWAETLQFRNFGIRDKPAEDVVRDAYEAWQ